MNATTGPTIWRNEECEYLCWLTFAEIEETEGREAMSNGADSPPHQEMEVSDVSEGEPRRVETRVKGSRLVKQQVAISRMTRKALASTENAIVAKGML